MFGKLTFPQVAIIHRHNSWECYFYMLPFPSYQITSFVTWQFINKCRYESTNAVIFQYNRRNINRIKLCGIVLGKKTMWLLFKILFTGKFPVW